MPRYVYRCTVCEELTTLFHLSEEVVTQCDKCSAPHGLVKLLTPFFTKNKTSAPKKRTGQVTEKFIKQSREELAQQKKELIDKSKT